MREWECALGLLAEMRERGLAPAIGHYTALTQALAGSGRVEEGLRRRMTDHERLASVAQAPLRRLDARA